MSALRRTNDILEQPSRNALRNSNRAKGKTQSYMVYPYYLPDERITMVVLLNSGANIPGTWRMLQDIAAIVSPAHPWTGLPKE